MLHGFGKSRLTLSMKFSISLSIMALFTLAFTSAYAQEDEMVLPPMSQVGTVVADLDAAMAYYEDILGIGPFTVFDFIPEHHWCEGRPCPVELRIGIAELAPGVALELVEPVAGDAPHQWFLDEYGEGLQHIGYEVENYDEWLDHFVSKGIDPIPLQNAEFNLGDGLRRAAYLKTDVVGGVVIELIEILPAVE